MARRRYRQKTKKELKELDRLGESDNPVYAEFRTKVTNYSYEKLKTEENTLLREQELLPARIIKLKEEVKVKEEELIEIYKKEESVIYSKQEFINQEIKSKTSLIEEEFYSKPHNKLKKQLGSGRDFQYGPESPWSIGSPFLSAFISSVFIIGFIFALFSFLLTFEFLVLAMVALFIGVFLLVGLVGLVVLFPFRYVDTKRYERNVALLKKLEILISNDAGLLDINKNLQAIKYEISVFEDKRSRYRKEIIEPLKDKINFSDRRESEISYLLVSILPELIKTARKKEKDARYSAVLGEARNSSQSIKETLSSSMNDDWACPYCNQVKEQETAEADHIYPVSKGGQSTPQNMVIVCYDCNRAKRDFTLRHFCKVSDFNFEEVADRLESLGNEI